MANITELQLQGDSTVHKLNDARITTTAVTTATHILTTNSAVSSIAPITAANLASVLGSEHVVAPITGIDANTIEDGLIHILNGTCIANSSNLPTGLKFGMLRGVIAFENDDNQWTYQILYDARLGNQYFRTKENTTWTSWKAISTT